MSQNLQKSAVVTEEDQQLVASLPAEIKEENYLEVGVRPWGVYYVLEDRANYKVKKIVVNSQQRLSLQSHQHRSEHWIVVSGSATVEVENMATNSQIQEQTNIQNNIPKFILTPNQSCYIPMGAKHRLSNMGKIPLVIVEVQVGEYTGEDDIARFEDDYARIQK